MWLVRAERRAAWKETRQSSRDPSRSFSERDCITFFALCKLQVSNRGGFVRASLRRRRRESERKEGEDGGGRRPWARTTAAASGSVSGPRAAMGRCLARSKRGRGATDASRADGTPVYAARGCVVWPDDGRARRTEYVHALRSGGLAHGAGERLEPGLVAGTQPGERAGDGVEPGIGRAAAGGGADDATGAEPHGRAAAGGSERPTRSTPMHAVADDGVQLPRPPGSSGAAARRASISRRERRAAGPRATAARARPPGRRPARGRRTVWPIRSRLGSATSAAERRTDEGHHRVAVDLDDVVGPRARRAAPGSCAAGGPRRGPRSRRRGAR